MNKIKYYFTSFVAFLMILFSVSCSGTTDESLVDDGLLHLSADKHSIQANGVDKVTFTVNYGLTDVSTAKTMSLIVLDSLDNRKELTPGSNVFSTTTPGKYKIYAEYTKGGKITSVDTIVITATEVAKSKYKHCVLGMYFTSEGCQACPNTAKDLKNLQSEYPDVIKAAAFHLDFLGVYDFLSIPESQNYLQYVFSARSQLPQFYYDIRKTDNGANPSYSRMEEDLLGELNNYRNTCGVAIKSNFNKDSRELEVNASITSDIENEYRYVIYLVEDGITSRNQSGINGEYIHNNVVRRILGSTTGERFPVEYRPIPANTEVTVTETTTIPEDWNVDNMRIIVTMLTTLDGGMTYTSNNTNECSLGGSVDYLYN